MFAVFTVVGMLFAVVCLVLGAPDFAIAGMIACPIFVPVSGAVLDYLGTLDFLE
jgi:hypothetical protein